MALQAPQAFFADSENGLATFNRLVGGLKLVSSKGELVSREAVTVRMLLQYYERLNKDPEFAEALRQLCNVLSCNMPTQNQTMARMDKYIPLEAKSLLADFASRWCLPQSEGKVDLWYSVWCATKGQPLLLRVSHRGITGDLALELPYIIQPSQPDAFEYHPLMCTHEDVKHIAEEAARKVYEDIMDQVRTLELRAKEQGWDHLPPQYHNSETVRLAAQRLYLRAIKRLSWSKIALQTSGSRGSVPGQVKEWAARLGIPIPVATKQRHSLV